MPVVLPGVLRMGGSSIRNLERAREIATGSARHSILSFRTVGPIAILVDALVVLAACAAWSVLSVGHGGQAVLFTLGIAPTVCGMFIPAAKLASLYKPSAVLGVSSPTYNVALLWLGIMALLGIGFFRVQ